MTKKWLLLITILVFASVLVSGCADNAEENDMEEETTEDTKPDEMPEESEPAGEGIDYAIRMEHYSMMKPSELEINRGDTVVWRNYKPQNTYVLISDDGLFEETEMYVHDTQTYTFTESGTYTFSVEDHPDMTLTITVR